MSNSTRWKMSSVVRKSRIGTHSEDSGVLGNISKKFESWILRSSTLLKPRLCRRVWWILLFSILLSYRRPNIYLCLAWFLPGFAPSFPVPQVFLKAAGMIKRRETHQDSLLMNKLSDGDGYRSSLQSRISSRVSSLLSSPLSFFFFSHCLTSLTPSSPFHLFLSFSLQMSFSLLLSVV